ncbi:hypothetical protein WJX73_003365 [Symbiochloris irregularis]|uniref:RNA exonuclease 4 n=1 Tax=Symbiochloris irregularis TaxID=706552 RepID=A0AAW1P470_9CHLO
MKVQAGKDNHASTKPLASSIPTSTAVPKQGAQQSANWLAIKAALHKQQQQQQQNGQAKGNSFGRKRRKLHAMRDLSMQVQDRDRAGLQAKRGPVEARGNATGPTAVMALDCEMVGVGPQGVRSALARVCIVNDCGHVLLDKHVKPAEPVTDYRTFVSGVRRHHLVDAPAFADVRAEVEALLNGRTIVGHALHNDLQALELEHPQHMIRDTAKYPPLMVTTAAGRKPHARSLRALALEHLALVIQAGEHTPVDDARAALYLYQQHHKEWNYRASRGTVHMLQAPVKADLESGAELVGNDALFRQLAAKDDMVDL